MTTTYNTDTNNKEDWREGIRRIWSNALDEETERRYGMNKHHPIEDCPLWFINDVDSLLIKAKEETERITREEERNYRKNKIEIEFKTLTGGKVGTISIVDTEALSFLRGDTSRIVEKHVEEHLRKCIDLLILEGGRSISERTKSDQSKDLSPVSPENL